MYDIIYMKKSMQELYKIIQMNHLWTVGSKSKHFSESNIKKNKIYSAQHQISWSQRTCRLRRLTDIPKTQHQTLRAWLWCYRCFIENTCLGSLSLHLVTIWQMPVHFSIDCLNLLWFSTWPCGQYWQYWLMRQPIVTQRAETSRLSTKAPIAPNLALPHAVRLNVLKTPPSHISYDQCYLTNL